MKWEGKSIKWALIWLSLLLMNTKNPAQYNSRREAKHICWYKFAFIVVKLQVDNNCKLQRRSLVDKDAWPLSTRGARSINIMHLLLNYLQCWSNLRRRQLADRMGWIFKHTEFYFEQTQMQRNSKQRHIVQCFALCSL